MYTLTLTLATGQCTMVFWRYLKSNQQLYFKVCLQQICSSFVVNYFGPNCHTWLVLTSIVSQYLVTIDCDLVYQCLARLSMPPPGALHSISCRAMSWRAEQSKDTIFVIAWDAQLLLNFLHVKYIWCWETVFSLACLQKRLLAILSSNFGLGKLHTQMILIHSWFTILLHGTRFFEWWPVNCPFWGSSG